MNKSSLHIVTVPPQSATMISKSTTLIILSLIPLASGFGTIGKIQHASTHMNPQLMTTPASRVSLSPLFVATYGSTEVLESPVLRSLNAEVEKAKRVRDRYQEKISLFDTKLKEIENKRSQYIECLKLGAVGNNFSETTIRSAAKAMMWRVIAGSITLLTSLKVLGSFVVALKIVCSDFFSKAFTMFIGERIMNKNQSGRKSGADSTGRSIAKALIWRLFAICNTLATSLFFAGDLKMASKIAGSDAIFKTGLMVAYERVWAKIEWGKEYLVEYPVELPLELEKLLTFYLRDDSEKEIEMKIWRQIHQ